MNFSFYKLGFLCLVLLGTSPLANAQKGKDDFQGGSTEVVKTYLPYLADAVKLDFPPSIVKPDTTKPEIKYAIQPKLLNLPFIPADIRPLAMVKEDKPALQNNYLKAGFGTQLSPYGELYLNTGRSNKYDAGLYAYHLSANSNSDFQNFSDNALQLNGKKFFKATALSARARYDRNVLYFYGYDHTNPDTTISFTKKNLRQIFSKFSAELNFENTKKNKSLFDYQWHFGFYNLADNYHANETNFNASIDLEKEVNKLHHIHFRFLADITSFKQDFLSPDANLFHVNPWYRFQNDKLKAIVGFNLVIPSGGSTLFFLPDIEAQYNVVGEYFTPFAGWKGYVDKNNFEKLTGINPFMDKYQPQAIGKLNDLFIGFKGSAGNHVSYLFKLSERIYDNLPIFLPDSNSITRFNVSYQQDAGELNVHGELGYKESERINFSLSGDYYNYQLDFQDTAFGYPAGKITAHADYNIQDKIIFGASLFTYSKTYTHVYLPFNTVTTALLKGYVDVNLSVQYNYKKNFGAFLNINNIASTKYQRWYRYPNYGFNLLAGLILKF